jgi:hypothetical protein
MRRIAYGDLRPTSFSPFKSADGFCKRAPLTLEIQIRRVLLKHIPRPVINKLAASDIVKLQSRNRSDEQRMVRTCPVLCLMIVRLALPLQAHSLSSFANSFFGL